MKIPIFGKVYLITIVEQSINDKDEDTDATIDFENNIIEITKKENNKNILHTILHELLHGVIERIGINQTDLSDNLEEVIVESFSTFLVDTFIIKFKKNLL